MEAVLKERIERVAERLWLADRTGKPVAPVRDEMAAWAREGIEGCEHLDQPGSARSLEVAYRIQQWQTERRIREGGRLVGRKIGLTSLAVQQQLGVDSPDYGALFADMAIGDGEEIPWSRTRQAKAEAEIALVLDRDLSHERHTFADLIRATAFALPAIEIVGSRIENWDIRLSDTVADNASSGLFVLGSRPVALKHLELAQCGMVMERKGEQVSVGSGMACLGNPLNAAVWLADMMVSLGSPLQAGDVVLTGALGPMVAVRPGDAFFVQIQGLGRVSAIFSNE